MVALARLAAPVHVCVVLLARDEVPLVFLRKQASPHALVEQSAMTDMEDDDFVELPAFNFKEDLVIFVRPFLGPEGPPLDHLFC